VGSRSLVALFLLTACGGPATSPQAPPPVDPVLPVATIAATTAARAAPRLQAVLRQLDHAEGEAWRRVLAAGAVDADAFRLIETTTSPAFVDVRTQTLANILLVDPASLSRPIGDPLTTITEVITERTDCVAAVVVRDDRPLRPAATPWRAALRLIAGVPPIPYVVDALFALDTAGDEQAAASLCG
jgi:hypothetical protein